MSKVYIGIDPGSEGFVTAIVDDEFFFKYLADLKVGKEWSILEFNKYFKEIKEICGDHPIHISLEDVNCDPSWTAKTNWSLSRCKAILETSFVAYGLPYTLIKPKEWQKEMFKGVPEMRKPSTTVTKKDKTVYVRKGGLDTKPMSILACQRLFPAIDLSKSDRARVPHDGKSDSILMAEYGKRKNL